MNGENIKAKDIIYAIKRRWQLVLIIVLISLIGSIIVNFFVLKPKYQAYTKVFIGKNNEESYNNNDVQMYQKLLDTYAEIIKTNDIIEKACKENNINIDSESILSKLIVESATNTQILTIKYLDYDKEQAVAIVDAITNEFVKVSSELISNSNVRIIEEVRIPKAPISPNKKMNIAITFVLSIMAGIALSILLELLDTTFKDKETIEKACEIPVIGIIPKEDNN